MSKMDREEMVCKCWDALREAAAQAESDARGALLGHLHRQADKKILAEAMGEKPPFDDGKTLHLKWEIERWKEIQEEHSDFWRKRLDARNQGEADTAGA